MLLLLSQNKWEGFRALVGTNKSGSVQTDGCFLFSLRFVPYFSMCSPSFGITSICDFREGHVPSRACYALCSNFCDVLSCHTVVIALSFPPLNPLIPTAALSLDIRIPPKWQCTVEPFQSKSAVNVVPFSCFLPSGFWLKTFTFPLFPPTTVVLRAKYSQQYLVCPCTYFH